MPQRSNAQRSSSPGAKVAAEVRAEMARQFRSQSELAAVLRVSQTAVSRRLKGEISFDVDELVRTADFLGVSIAQLLSGAVA